MDAAACRDRFHHAFRHASRPRGVQEKTKKVAGVLVHYKVVLPNGYDPAKTYPAILAFGGGPQTMNTVDIFWTAICVRKLKNAAIL